MHLWFHAQLAQKTLDGFYCTWVEEKTRRFHFSVFSSFKTASKRNRERDKLKLTNFQGCFFPYLSVSDFWEK